MAKDKLVVAEPFSLAPLEVGMDEVKDLIKSNIGPEGISAFDLERAINPGSGSTKWKIPGLDEKPEETDVIEGIILYHRFVRVFYEGEYKGGGDVPNCSSENGMVGVGNPGGDCLDCPFQEWGSGKNDGKACRGVKQLFIQRTGSLLPTLVNISPVNLGHPKFFLMQLLNKKRLKAEHILTKIRLVADKSKKSGYDYARTDFSMTRELNEEEKFAAEELKKIWQPLIEARPFTIDVTPDAIDEDYSEVTPDIGDDPVADPDF